MPKNPRWSELGWRGPHPGYLGGLVIEQPVLIRESNVVAYVSRISSYPEGFLFTAFVEQATERAATRAEEPMLEVRFGDGRLWREDPDRFSEFLLAVDSESSSGQGGASWRKQCWVPALPPPEPVVFAVSIGPTEGSATIEGAILIEAADRAIDLWELPPNDRWFAQ